MHYYSWEWVEVAAVQLARAIRAGGKRYNGVYAIPRGGLVLGVRLSHVLGLPLLAPDEAFGPTTLVVDDNTVAGDTLRLYAQVGCDTVVLVHNPISSVVPTYFAAQSDEWPVFPWEIAAIDAVLLARDVAMVES